MNTRTLLTTAALTLTALTIPAGAAHATGNRCTPYTHTTTSGWTADAGATIELLDKGIKVVTPETASKAGFTVLVDVPAKSVKSASYQTLKYDTVAPAALPGFRLALDVDDDGTADGTVVYEPYYQIVGNPAVGTAQTWDVLSGKFWTSSDKIAGMVKEGGGSYAGNKTWAEILAANPEAQVLGYGIGQGTYNAGASARVNELKFFAHSTIVTGSASPSPSASVSPSPSKSPVVVVPANNSQGLPNTGSPIKLILGTGFLAAAAGAVLLFMRRRKTRFEA